MQGHAPSAAMPIVSDMVVVVGAGPDLLPRKALLLHSSRTPLLPDHGDNMPLLTPGHRTESVAAQAHVIVVVVVQEHARLSCHHAWAFDGAGRRQVGGLHL